MNRLFLIRHGKPSATWGGSDDDPGLDEVGLAQARGAAEFLLGLRVGERPTRVVSSPLRRCRETAAPLAAALKVKIEIVPGVGEIPTPRQIAPAERGAWLREAFAGRWSQVRGDIDYLQWRREVWREVAARPGAAIFSHFVAINAVLSVINDSDLMIGFRPDHASITSLEVEGDALSLVSLGREASTGVL